MRTRAAKKGRKAPGTTPLPEPKPPLPEPGRVVPLSLPEHAAPPLPRPERKQPSAPRRITPPPMPVRRTPPPRRQPKGR
ncbi:hypothetical protein GCM10009677_21160 [Sphaerisporangium rubeum]|uniref:Uncharacterized protein n=1 Tax=Sphaerisporangium rubeum TaxID=321317 RepID=A0A7X0IDP2_9ACTN|nr:hypothetical protein [Sphaerisporangium rubeum]